MEDKMTDWNTPKEVSNIDIAFPAQVSHLLPAWEEIPEKYKKDHDPAVDLMQTWFYQGLAETEFISREGVDKIKALRQVKACLGSFEPKHEHKTAGVAYLLSLFFSEVKSKDKTWKLEVS